MGERTSNKEILNAIEGQTASIDKLVTALTAGAMGKEVPAPSSATDTIVTPVTEGEDDNGLIEVAEAYLAKMTEKAANHATSKGCEVVLYARKNQRGETKLAYALRERFDTLTDKGLIGPVGTFQP